MSFTLSLAKLNDILDSAKLSLHYLNETIHDEHADREMLDSNILHYVSDSLVFNATKELLNECVQGSEHNWASDVLDVYQKYNDFDTKLSTFEHTYDIFAEFFGRLNGSDEEFPSEEDL